MSSNSPSPNRSANHSYSHKYVPSRPKSQATIRNFSNPQYHTGIDLAKAYSGMVDSHLFHSKWENHALKSACRIYVHGIEKDGQDKSKIKDEGNGKNMASTSNSVFKNSQLVRVKSASLPSKIKRQTPSFSSSAIKPIKVQNNRIIPLSQNPELGSQTQQQLQMPEPYSPNPRLLQKLLIHKTNRVPQYSQEVQDVCKYKDSLQQQIAELKKLINYQRKFRDKVRLNCNKIQNEQQNVYKMYVSKAEQNYHLATAIGTTQKQIKLLWDEVTSLKQKNGMTQQNWAETQIQVHQLKQYVEKTRLIVMGQEKDVSKLKTMVSTSINNMSNTWINVNLLKGEKANILGDVEGSYGRNK